MKKSRSTGSHFTHARSCSRALNRPLNQVPTRAKRPAFIRTYSLWQRDIFPYDRFTGYKKSNQNQFGRALPFAFALTCNNIYLLYSSLSDFDSFRWRVHLSDGVCRLRARVHLKTLSSLFKQLATRYAVRGEIKFKTRQDNRVSQRCSFVYLQYVELCSHMHCTGFPTEITIMVNGFIQYQTKNCSNFTCVEDNLFLASS